MKTSCEPSCQTVGCYLTAFFRPEVMWLPVLQLLKAEDAYAPCRATFGSLFHSPSLGSSGVRKSNKMAANTNSLASKFPLIHYYTNANTVILLQFTYYISIHTYTHTDIPPEV